MVVPSGTEAARAFIPAKDFDLSKAFYEALGFKKLLDGDVAIFGVGAKVTSRRPLPRLFSAVIGIFETARCFSGATA